MESYIVDWDRDTTISSFSESIADLFENTIIPKISACANMTYLGMASSSNRREAVFQIKDYETLYLRLCKYERDDFYSTSGWPYWRLSTTADLATCNSYYTTSPGNVSISYGGTPGFTQTNNINMKFNFQLLTDDETNKNLKVIWQCKAPNATLNNSQGIIIGETESGRDFVGVIGDGSNPICIIYLDDPDLAVYRIPSDTTKYGVSGKLLKRNWMPMTTSNNVETVVDNLDPSFVRIVSTEIDSVEDSNYNKNSSSVRKLVQIGNDYYRQIVVNYWCADPKGDETPITITNVT